MSEPALIAPRVEKTRAPSPSSARGRRRSGAVVVQLLVAVVPTVLLVQLLAQLLLEFRAGAIANATALERINRLADARARVLGEPLWRLEYDKLRASLEEISLDPNVALAAIEDDTGIDVAFQLGASRYAGSQKVTRDLFYENGVVRTRAGRLIVSFAEVPVYTDMGDLFGSGLLVSLLAALALCGALGLSAHALVGRPLAEIVGAIQRAKQDGNRHVVALHSNNEIGQLATAFNEFQQGQAAAKMQLEYHATHDELTGLPNRRMLQQRLSALGESPARKLGLHFVDLDDFKGINDTFGHANGDRYLAHVAANLRACANSSNWVARLGGDEFVVLQDDVADEAEARAFAVSLLAAIAAPVEINGKSIVPRGSVGVAVRRTDEPEAANLLALADIALYDAKEHSLDGVAVLTPQLLHGYLRRKELALALPAAIRQGQLETWFQAQFDIHTGDIVGLEALARWRHPEHGMISPAEFIPIIEETGASTDLARSVFERLCEARRALMREGLGELSIAMNVSPHELTDFSFFNDMVATAHRYNVPLAGFEIEITEGLLINNVAHTREALARVREAGVRVALDDFGQGYSSLAYLRRFPLDRLKIDKAFARDIPDNKGDMSVLEIIVSLANKLDLEVVIEGVEREAQAEALRGLGVRIGQGFLYHRPQPLADLIQFIRRSAAADTGLRAAS